MPDNSVRLWARRAACVIVAAAAASCAAPEASPTPTLGTPKPFTPGDPTATPPGEDITDRDYLAGKEAYRAGDYAA
ncbi:MAG TPA: hypothetical protein VFI11_11325, partial [Anaerolineales bacterium]|nr:hypothetical protein [Anaerolineales bacterium]